MRKRLLSAMLTFTFALSIVQSVSITASAEEEPNYLTFTAEEADSWVQFGFESGTIEYRTNDGTGWTDWTAGTNETTVTLEEIGDKVSYRGTNIITNISDNCYCYAGGKVAASGDVTSVTNGKGGDATLSDFSYFYMFNECTALTKAPNLPSTTLSEACYESMFYGCTSLTEAPKLSATNLAVGCYRYMFNNCTSLTRVPELPATNLEDYCYYHMFEGCSGIKLYETDEGFGSFGFSSDVQEGTSSLSSMFKSIGGSVAATPEIGETYYYTAPDYIIFTSDAAFSVKPAGDWDGTLQYSTDNVTWTDVTQGSTLNSSSYTFELYLRGKDNTVITGGNYPWVLTPAQGHKIAVKGNIMMLINYESPNGKVILTEDEYYDNETFFEMYDSYEAYLTNEIGIVSADTFDYLYDDYFSEYPDYSSYVTAKTAIVLGENAFAYMFYGQDCLVSMPALWVKNLSNKCYAHMFENCSGIKIGTTDAGFGKWYGVSSNATGGEEQFTDIFKGTSGTFTEEPEVGTVYYYETVASFDSYATVVAPQDQESYPSTQGGVDANGTGTIRFIWEIKLKGDADVDSLGSYVVPFDLFDGDTTTSKFCGMSTIPDELSNGDTYSTDLTSIPVDYFDKQMYAIPYVNGNVVLSSALQTSINDFAE